MTVAENLAFPLKNRRLSSALRSSARVAEIAEMLDLTGDLEPARARPDGRRQAEDFARPRTRALGRLGGPVRRAADGDRSGAEMGAALEAEGGASRARPADDLCDA